MFSLTIVFGPQATSWTLMFKTEERLQEELKTLLISKTPLIDDFGQNVTIETAQIHGYMIEDMEQSKLAHIERALHQARTQAQASNLAESDPSLRAMRSRHQTPMIQPMGGMMPPNGRGYPG